MALRQSLDMSGDRNSTTASDRISGSLSRMDLAWHECVQSKQALMMSSAEIEVGGGGHMLPVVLGALVPAPLDAAPVSLAAAPLSLLPLPLPHAAC